MIAIRYNSNTKLLLHMDGTNGSTVIADTSTDPKGTATVSGGAQISTTQSKFGGAALSVNGTTGYIQYPDSPDWDFPGDFTVEAWVYSTARAPTGYVSAIASHSGTNYWLLFIDENGSAGISATQGGTNVGAGGPSTVPLNTWTHIAFVRSGGMGRIYINGVGGTAVTIPASDSSDPLFIGCYGSAAHWFAGYIDEFRISQNARWTANFTPPTTPYS
jgi:hypothetical protein